MIRIEPRRQVVRLLASHHLERADMDDRPDARCEVVDALKPAERCEKHFAAA